MAKNSTTVTSIVTQGRGLLEQLSAEVSSLEKRRDKLLSERQSLVLKRADLFGRPLSQADVAQVMCELVDVRAEGYRTLCQRENVLEKIAYPMRSGTNEQLPMNFRDAEDAVGRRHEDVGIAAPRLEDGGGRLPLLITPHGNMNWVYFLFGDLIKEKIRAQIEAEGLPLTEEDRQKAGPSLDERRQELEACNTRIAALDVQVSQLDEAIAELAVNLDTPEGRKQEIEQLLGRVKVGLEKVGELHFILADVHPGMAKKDEQKNAIFNKVQVAADTYDKELSAFDVELQSLAEEGVPLSRYRAKVPMMRDQLATIESEIDGQLADVRGIR